MNIGSAVKTLRKKKGYSQKEFAERCGLSVNALCQIETNASFPQRATINRICDELSIPDSYLLFFSVDEQDIPEGKRKLFHQLNDTIKLLLLEDI
ncbi:helix-turn-helix transcriptional regulator [Pontibacter sp. 172403-2]|uniref:helix-turn-helix domain-containing protein n=1 Tax=Pontibacter rufus TaxID=2791028 RepID=UPI0018B01408|nr:helix-turn-helix transcriptional regulator [Pontibacter sp. 172403-2]